MRINRSKSSRKVLKLYKLLFGIDTPYNVILDGNFIFHALKYNVDIITRVKRLLHEYDANLYLHVMKSVVTELKQIKEKGTESLNFIKTHCREVDDSSISGTSVSERTVNFMSAFYSCNIYHVFSAAVC